MGEAAGGRGRRAQLKMRLAQVDSNSVRRCLTLFSVTLAASTALVLASGASLASASPTTEYQAHLNAFCRSFMPRFKQLNSEMEAALTANDLTTYYRALARSVALSLQVDGGIRRAPVPSAMRVRMTPALKLLKQAQALRRSAVASAAWGDKVGVGAALRQIAVIANPVQTALNEAGLKSCGAIAP
jgi:hypothetical protein